MRHIEAILFDCDGVLLDSEPMGCGALAQALTAAGYPMTIDEALYEMELIGHDFFLFVDARTDHPSVVYRRKGWDYGVISLTTQASPEEEALAS